jgi:HAD superfamily phosphoserine phosphatase-like hydrolase
MTRKTAINRRPVSNATASRPVRLVAFDLDGTLIRGPTICETLAMSFGTLSRMREIEQLRDVAQIRAARDEMLGWYGDGPRDALCGRLADVQIAPGAEQAFTRLAQRGVVTVIVSITWGFAVAWFARRFGAAAWIGTEVTQAGEVQHFWPGDKPVWLAEYAAQRGIRISDVAAVGDSPGDVPMLAAVGHPIFVGAALPAEIAHAVHAPDADMRDIADLILARGSATFPPRRS